MFIDRSTKSGEQSAEDLKNEHGPESGADKVANGRQEIIGRGVENIRRALSPNESNIVSEVPDDVEVVDGSKMLDDPELELRRLGDEARRRIETMPEKKPQIGDSEQEVSARTPRDQSDKHSDNHIDEIRRIVEKRYELDKAA